jgi:uncharacterized protein (TIGR02466 family)
MKKNYKEIWATPIGEYWLEDMSIHQELEDLVQKKYHNNKKGIDDTVHLFDVDTKFSLWVKECTKDFVNNFFPAEEVTIQRAWCTVQHHLHDNFIHVHNLVDLAAVYYLHTLTEHPPLEIFDPRQPHKFNRVNRLMADGNIASGFVSIQIPPEKYKLVIHPGYLLHGVGTNKSKESRASVAMNLIVKPPKGYTPPVVTKY